MTASVKVVGAWHGLVGAKVRVAGTWHTASKGFVKVAGTWRQWLASLITDSFNRANSASLGSTDTGDAWSTLRGTAWAIVSNQASNSDAASNYPIAQIALGSTDTTTSVSVSQGCGPVVWITDTNNWWTSYHYSSTVANCAGPATGYIYSSTPTCACGSVVNDGGTCTGSTVSCNSLNTTCTPVGGCGTVTCTSVDQYNCYGGYTSGSCGGAGGTWNGTQCCFTEPYYTCTQNTTVIHYGCSATASSSTQHALRMAKNVAGTVSTVADTVVASAPAAIKIVTNANSITATAYSDAAMTTSIGTNAQTNTGTKGTSVGIVKAPGGLAQGSTVDTFSTTV
jgi:hypothetical protein